MSACGSPAIVVDHGSSAFRAGELGSQRAHASPPNALQGVGPIMTTIWVCETRRIRWN